MLLLGPSVATRQVGHAPLPLARAPLARAHGKSHHRPRHARRPIFAPLNAVPPVCFDAHCQQLADEAFLFGLAVPVIVGVGALAVLLRPVPTELKDSGKVFEDPETGIVFGTSDGQQPLRDKKGELAFRAISYTPWPVEATFEGQRLTLEVGPANALQPRTFVFNRLLGPRSEVLSVKLQRPLGVVWELEETTGRIMVAGFVPNSNAERARKVAALEPQHLRGCLMEGDVLRAVTTTNIVYPTDALFGMKPAQRHTVVYGADKQKFNAVMDALRDLQGDRGPAAAAATLVVERRRIGAEQQ